MKPLTEKLLYETILKVLDVHAAQADKEERLVADDSAAKVAEKEKKSNISESNQAVVQTVYSGRILLVEDHPTEQELAQLNLQSVGFTVDIASNARRSDSILASPSLRFDFNGLPVTRERWFQCSGRNPTS